MARSDPHDPEPGAGIALRDLLGLRGRAAWLFLLVLELTLALYLVQDLTAAPPLAVLGGAALMLTAGALVLVVPVDPLPVLVTVFVAAAGPVTTLLTAANLWSERAHHLVWASYAASYLMSVLVLRGRLLGAWLGMAGVTLVIAVSGLRAALPFSAIVGSIVPVGTLIALSVFALVMRPTQRSLRILREESTIRAAASATMSAADGERIQQLARLDRLARPILERIAEGAVLTGTEREKCRLLEAELRDGLRAPQLVTDELSDAARGARCRGVAVVLLDDGGFAGVPQWVRERVINAATRELDAANAGSVTVRVLPLGRRTLATVLAHAPDHDRRTEIDTSGNISVSL
jgi:hypothetical protein